MECEKALISPSLPSTDKKKSSSTLQTVDDRSEPSDLSDLGRPVTLESVNSGESDKSSSYNSRSTSSPTLSSYDAERSTMPTTDYQSEPSALSDMGLPKSAEAADNAGDGSDKGSDNSSTKAEFFIGDEGLVRSQSVSFATDAIRENLKMFAAHENYTKIIPNKEEEASEEEVPEFIPPDGGYGWVIVFSACVINLFIVGFIKSYGVLYVSIIENFPDATAYQASWLPVFLSTTGLLIAPVTGVLCRKFTSRKVSFVGGIFAFAGIFLGTFAKSMVEMIFTFGLLTGIGAGLTTTPAVLITSLYFEKRRALASAICVSGNAIGGFLFPPITDYFLRVYGLKGTLYIISALQLHICAASMLFRPITLHAMIEHKRKKRLKYKAQNYLPVEEQETLVSPTEEEKITYNANRRGSLMKSAILRRLQSEAPSIDDEELRYQLSFLRSCSMMNSIPDLSEYARSWSYDQSAGVTFGEASYKTIFKSGINLSANNKSSTELEKTCIMNTCSRSSLQSTVRTTAESQPLTREISKRARNSKMPLVLELESDSDTSIEDNKEVSAPVSPEVAKPKENGQAKPDIVQFDQNLNIEQGKQLSKPNEKLETEKKPAAKSKFFDRELLKTSSLWLMCATVAFMAIGAPHALFFLPAFAKSVDIDKEAVIYVMSISSIVDLFGRLGTGFVSDLNIINTSLLYGVLEALAGVAIVILPFMTNITGVGVLLSLYGLGVGGWFVLIPTILAKHHGPQKLAASYGIVRLCQGIMNCISPQVSGILIDVSGTYSSSYFFMGSAMLMGGILKMMEIFVVSMNRKRKKTVTCDADIS